MISLNIVWPAMYVAEELFRFWFLVIATIVIETFTIKLLLQYSLLKSLKLSVVANLVSGFIGVVFMMMAMLFWHMISDAILGNNTFNNVNWMTTYILMCFGSIVIEVLTIKIIFRETAKRLFKPLLIGNLLTYSFIAYTMISDQKAFSKNKTETSLYFAEKSQFILMDSTKLHIAKMTTLLPHDDKTKVLNINHPFIIFFERENPKNIELKFRLLQNSFLRIDEREKKILFNEQLDTLIIVLEQKYLNHKNGKFTTVYTDTISFAKDQYIPKYRSYPGLLE